MVNISDILVFLNSKFFASNKICFSSKVKGDAIAKAFIVSSRLCFSNAFQLITNPLFSKRVFRSLKIRFHGAVLHSGWSMFERVILDTKSGDAEDPHTRSDEPVAIRNFTKP